VIEERLFQRDVSASSVSASRSGGGADMQKLRQLWEDETGTVAVEYSIMLTFILIAVIGSVTLFGLSAKTKWIGIGTSLNANGV